MFKKKYSVSMLDSKWNVIKSNIKLEVIPRADEYIWDVDIYYRVLNVIHSTNNKQGVYIIVEPIGKTITP